ncbi:MAG: acyl-CoA dehydrogenase family protein [Rhodococcus sp. (in: high G+C Gram-positive bacteria)]|uniref:acyl-CoA dehydrogenase family protein n=1 Tax=Rhodococcus sp. TaxID=1831 RepID=UPI002ADB8C4C|nr:acyl-CoA dehydrogenase family protein [Rhodococcus sp. (in: high G+C Gram-positive bacteria)]
MSMTLDVQPNVVLDRTRELTAEIAERAREIEHSRAVPMDIIDRLQEAGVFRMSLPRSIGGEEFGLVEASDVIFEIAKADASTAWQVMVSQGMPWFASRLPSESLQKLYADGPDMLIKGAFAPKGRAIPVEGGYRLSGRWPLASGNFRYQKVIAGFMVQEKDGVRMSPDGTMPDIRFAVLDPDQVTFLDTWDAIGLRGTHSDDFTVEDVFVPEEWTGPFVGKSNFEGAYFNLPPVPTGPHHLGVAMGILRGAIDDVATLSLTKRGAYNPAKLLCDDEVFLNSFGEIEVVATSLDAMRQNVAETVMSRAEAGQAPSPIEIARLAAATSFGHHEAMRSVNKLVELAGSQAIYSSHPLQRRFRDIRAASQHVAAYTSNYTSHGAALVAAAR